MENPELRIDNLDLSPKQRHTIVLLSRGATIAQAAKAVGVSETTIYNWKTDLDFCEHIKDETRCYLDDVRATLASFTTPALERLRQLVDSEDPNVALKAIDRVLKATGMDSLSAGNHICRHLGLETAYSHEQDEAAHLEAMANLST